MHTPYVNARLLMTVHTLQKEKKKNRLHVVWYCACAPVSPLAVFFFIVDQSAISMEGCKSVIYLMNYSVSPKEADYSVR